jgi:hypothetical protein
MFRDRATGRAYETQNGFNSFQPSIVVHAHEMLINAGTYLLAALPLVQVHGYSCAHMNVCPTDIVLAPAERIWNLLTDRRKLAEWTGTRLAHGPAGPLATGDQFVLRAGMFRLSLKVVDVRPPWQLVLDVRLPFGVTNHEEIQIMPIDSDSNRVTFN